MAYAPLARRKTAVFVVLLGIASMTVSGVVCEENRLVIHADKGTETISRHIYSRILTAAAMNAHNTFDHPETVKPAPFNGTKQQGNSLSFTMPSKSVIVLKIGA